LSALETYLKHAAEVKGFWHKGRIRDLREYIAQSRREEIIAAIKTIKDQNLLRILWEVGLDTQLQQVVQYQSERLAKEAGEVT